jgi:peptidoglycan/xylan/chitin deacetylase (PgdA/CDA1 family)
MAGAMGVSRAVYRFLAGVGADRLFWNLDSHRLRILCYHGVCPDAVKGTNWTPEFFVTASDFENHMRHLSANARVLPLAEAAARLRDGTLPPRSACITFDDGYANNLHLAYPVLEKYGLPATIFVSSSYSQTADFYPFLKLKLIELKLGPGEARQVLVNYKSAPLDAVMERVDPWWQSVRAGLADIQLETLRPLTVPELRAFDPKLVEFGGHSHTHCIFGNENEARRRQEIRACLSAIGEWTGRQVRLFAYPNGQRGDFGPFDQDILRAEGVVVAVSGIAGANGVDADPLALRRYPVGMYHDQDGFRAEVSGMRTAILRVS